MLLRLTPYAINLNDILPNYGLKFYIVLYNNNNMNTTHYTFTFWNHYFKIIVYLLYFYYFKIIVHLLYLESLF